MRIALFRARGDAAASAARLRRLGFATASLPVIEARPLAFAPRRERYDAVIATSAKAFLRDAPVDHAAPMFVAGDKTRRAAERRGWRNVAPPAPDSAHLVDLVERAVPPGAAVLYLAGRDRKPTLEAALMTTREVDIETVYAAEARKRWTSKEILALGGCAGALHYSRRSAALAARLAAAAGLEGHFRRMSHICISADAALPLAEAGAGDVRVATRPEEDGLLTALLEATAPVSIPCPVPYIGSR